MGAVGTIVRDPGVVAIAVPNTTTIVRGNAVTIDSGTKLGRVPGVNTEHVYGIATSDGDPDTLQVPVATRGGYTVMIKPTAAITFANGDLVYSDGAGGFTNVVGTNLSATIIGWIVDSRLDAQGNIEMAFLTV